MQVASADTIRAVREGMVVKPGTMTDLHYDHELQKFTGIVRHKAGVLGMSSPMELEPSLSVVKILSSGIQGWLFPPEMELLYELAGQVKSHRAIVEIGSYCGRSTVCLAWGAKQGLGATVYAVDPHTGSEEHQGYMAHSMGSLPYFRSNMRRAGLERDVVSMITTSEAAVRQVPGPVGLIFIDGDHSQAHKDLSMWYHKIAPGAWVLFHDSVGGAWPDVETDVARAVSDGMIEKLEEIGTITVARKAVPCD